ncbi:MAG TPA: nuclear transport factor 2 family protein [Mycobacteriales bacterium]
MRIPTKAAAVLAALVAAGGLAALPAAASPAAAAPAGPSPAAAAPAGAGRATGCERQLLAANAAFDRAFQSKDLDAFIDFYTDDATIIYYNGRRPYTKAEARINSEALFALDWTATFDVLKRTVRGCHSAQIIEDAHFTLNGTTAHFLVGLSWVREHGRWKVAIDQSTALPA